MKACRRWGVELGAEVDFHSFTSALDEGKRLTSCPGRFTAGETTQVPLEWEAGLAPEPV